MDDLELVGRIAQHAERARGVTGRQDEPVAVGGERRDEVAQHRPQAGKALEGPQFQELVEEKRGWRVARRARGAEPGERGVEGRAGGRIGAYGRGARVERERRHVADRLEQSLGRRRDAFDVDVLARAASEEIADAQEQ